MTAEPRRALILAGGGIRVAWQAGVVQALDEAGLTFEHGDGTSGGIFTLAMLMSGVRPSELGERWRTLQVRRFVSPLPLREYMRPPTSWPALGGPRGLHTAVLPHLGIDVDAIRSATAMSGTFNVADFDRKICVAIAHDEIDVERMVAGVSLPIFLPAVASGGRTWTDAVWIRDANLLEAVRRGCTELWLVWCIGNSPRWGTGPLEQYVHMIELSANGALFAELAQIADINERRAAGEAVFGTTEQVVLHVVKPDHPLPLDPDFVTGRISAEALVAMGYRDACTYLSNRSPSGVALDHTATAMHDPPLGLRLSVRIGGVLTGAGRAPETFTASTVVTITDLGALLADPATAAGVVGGLWTSRWGYRPFVTGSASVTEIDGGRTIDLRCTVRVDGGIATISMSTTVPHRPARRRWQTARRWLVGLNGPDDALAGTGEISARDALRLLYMFEPSGVHSLSDRFDVIKMAARLTRAEAVVSRAHTS